MSLEPFPFDGPLKTRKPMVQVIDQSIRDEHSQSMPSREERKEIMASISVQFSNASCEKVMARGDAKVCGRCKQVCVDYYFALERDLKIAKARYCSQSCQKTHW